MKSIKSSECSCSRNRPWQRRFLFAKTIKNSECSCSQRRLRKETLLVAGAFEQGHKQVPCLQRRSGERFWSTTVVATIFYWHRSKPWLVRFLRRLTRDVGRASYCSIDESRVTLCSRILFSKNFSFKQRPWQVVPGVVRRIIRLLPVAQENRHPTHSPFRC